ncbi:MAG TPA: hypothetical protein VJU13_11305, partial [Candidatus Nitrosocosmicus sp.]|nr:hypothetical protein [Candidatus Nitrosocosmicus sp.]
NIFTKHFDEYDPKSYTEFLKLLNSFLQNNTFKSIYIVANKFIKKLLPIIELPKETEVIIEDFIGYKLD